MIIEIRGDGNMTPVERFLKYVKVHTMGCEESETVPSTSRQFDLAKILVRASVYQGTDGITILNNDEPFFRLWENP